VQALGPLVLTTRTLGAATGVSQAALDVALALSQRCSELRIRAWVPTHLPGEVDGRKLQRCVWEPVSPLTAARSVLLGEAPPRALFEHTRRARLLHVPRLREVPVLEVVNGLGAHALFSAANRNMHTPGLLVVHESPRHFDEPRRLDKEGALAALRSYEHRVYVSQRGQKEWDSLAGLDPAGSFYIPNCVHEQRVTRVLAQPRADLRLKLGYAPNRVQVLCVGQVSARKGQDLLLTALEAVPPSAADIQLDLVGDCRSDWARALQARAATTAFAGRVRFLGQVGDVYERVYAADLVVLASRAEASPLAVLEAMALGTCVIAADIDGIGEQVVDEETGLLFHRENLQELTGCLLRLSRDPSQRARLARAARARYLERFSRERQLGRWNAVLRAVVSPGTRP
jgi:glycosyltransferase involved in cell wall biosynthesis